MRGLTRLLAGATLAIAAPAMAQPQQPAAPAARPAPKLVVMISVDQFSGNLFDEYRRYFTGGLARLQEGAVFPNGYQSHAATETCPGHSTILTGSRPARTGIIANEWFDQSIAREDKRVYCAEDPTVPGTSSRDYAPTVMTLRVPTMGGYMKAANPAAKVISVAGKDRAAIMMGGNTLYKIWCWRVRGFTSYRGTALTPLVERVNSGVQMMLDQDRPAMDLPALCKSTDHAIALSPTLSVGAGHFARKAGDQIAFRASPEADAAVLALAASLVDDQKLGTGTATDLLIVGLSATDYVGHTYGSRGSEMCLQMMSLDREMGAFFDRLDSKGIDYMVALTADHGGPDLTERQQMQAISDAERAAADLYPAQTSAIISQRTGIKASNGDVLLGTGPFGDIYVNRTLSAPQRTKVLAQARAFYAAHPQIAAVFTADELRAAPAPSGPPEDWSLLTRAKASFDPARSGDLIILLKPRVMGIHTPAPGYVVAHGSPWDYDRNVPMLFWRKDMPRMEQPQGVETVDILPTLAAQIGLPLPMAQIDGKCLDLDPGSASSCPAR